MLLPLAACVSRPRAAAVEGQPPPPVPVPSPRERGCVESEDLKPFVVELGQERERARERALAAQGGQWVLRRGSYSTAAPALDETVELEGARWVTVGHRPGTGSAMQRLARVGRVLYRIVERAAGHPVQLTSCGVRGCSRARAPLPPKARPRMVELREGEVWGGPLELEYDYWWADVTPRGQRDCL